MEGRGACLAREHPVLEEEVGGGTVFDSIRQPASEDPYKRFLRGEDVSDDEDEEFHPDGFEDGLDSMPTPSSLSEDEDDDGDETGVVEVEEFTEQAQLFADLSTSATQMASAPLLLAHMTDTSPSPLTRRGYRRLVSGSRRAPRIGAFWTSPDGGGRCGGHFRDIYEYTPASHHDSSRVRYAAINDSLLDYGCLQDGARFPCTCLHRRTVACAPLASAVGDVGATLLRVLNRYEKPDALLNIPLERGIYNL
ncbi:hypothetical protein NUW54_g12181 [Trametes sanguinea]|uniref:Uncharacterized protein n=1 Tax=Trametes sanguinea TaxID=158606 RepID=A0ACC1N0N2_9APHY|nr:hypothetical protein NUW54_g12181 [Trametes sanguinea]